jgi:hypothetical protein
MTAPSETTRLSSGPAITRQDLARNGSMPLATLLHKNAKPLSDPFRIDQHFRRIMGWNDLWQLKTILGREKLAAKQEVA